MMTTDYIKADLADPFVAGRIKCHEGSNIVDSEAKYVAKPFRTRDITTMGQAFIDAGIRTVKQATVSVTHYKNMARP
jgi:hypothetical protein